MPDDLPAPPRHLSSESAELWRHIHESFELEEFECKTLRLALEALDRSRQAGRAIRRHGLVYQDRWGAPHSRPEVRIEQEARNSWVRLMRALNLPTDDEPAPQPRTRRGRYAAARNKGARHA